MDIKVTKEIIKKHGITPEEFEMIKGILGREPNFTELGIFSVMWSEHCSYKNSRIHLKTLPTSGEKVMIKAGEENAGALDIGGGWAVVFKIESHNHPSAIEPFQGAATGVGGIIRDIFTMGARPIAGMNSLRFGRLTDPTVKHLFTGVVAGIAHYGNCIGIPTVGGEVYFDETYEGNPLVNVFCLGVIKHSDLVKGAAKGVGNPVFYLGATTGRDGLGGAAFASKEITEASHEDRPAVQVGDPFMEKLLLEACLELIRTGYVVGIQDMGAAGLTCSTCETASRGNAGIEIDVSLVPKREAGMIPYEIMLSESQERMLVIVHKGKEKEVEKIFKKWDLHAVQIGHVTKDGIMRVKENGNVVSEIPAKALADEGPLYKREYKEPAYYKKVKAFKFDKVKQPKDLNAVLKTLMGNWSIASKRWVWEQYDHMVRTNTVVLPGSDAAVLRVKDINRYLAMSTDCNGTFVYLDPYVGAQIAVAESSRNCVCSGAVPIGVTNCLNFGNPMKPEIFWQFKNAVQGLGDACRSFGIPVTGGNVSFYNESPKGAVDPTPSIGTVGLIEKEEHITTQYFKDEGDAVVLFGNARHELGGSQYMKMVHGLKTGAVPKLDLKEEKALHKATLEAIHLGLVKSAHDCSEGGLAVALAESCVSSDLKKTGCAIDLDPKFFKSKRADALLFGESQSRIVVSCAARNANALQRVARKHGVAATLLGTVGGNNVVIRYGKETLIDLPAGVLDDIWNNSIERTLVTKKSSGAASDVFTLDK